MARFRRGAFPGGNPWQVLRSMHPKSGLRRENRQFAARFARHASEMSWFWQDMRAMHPKSPANRLSGTHGAKILPGRTPFRCTDPSNHARRANVTIRRSAKPPERPRPRRRHRSLPTPASSLSPRRTTLSSPTAPPVETASTSPPPRRFAKLSSPKGRAIFPTCGACLLCSWQMRSVCKRQTEPLLRDYFVMVA